MVHYNSIRSYNVTVIAFKLRKHVQNKASLQLSTLVKLFNANQQ